MTLTKEDNFALLMLAKESIAGRIDPDSERPVSTPVYSQNLHLKCGAFVSLYVEGKLRGCIGTFSEEEPLYKNVQIMAVSAATSDSRFSPIRSGELECLKIEISVLSPRVRVSDKSEIIIGKHGIYMKKGLNKGTLLPQVAVSQNWTLDEFLGNCARNKTGIGWDGWKTAELYTYEASVINSEDYFQNC